MGQTLRKGLDVGRPDAVFIVALDSELLRDQVVEYEDFKVLLLGIG